MKKIVLSSVLVLAVLFLSSTSFTFANTDMENARNDVRNVVGGAENVVQDTAKDTAGAIRSGLNSIGNTTENAMNDMKNAGNIGNDARDTANSYYTATRTSAENAGNFLGNAFNNIWVWMVIAIIALAIIAMIWYYVANMNNRNND